jgi:hypothetical protein
MSGKRVRNNTIGEGIYERIKDYDTVSRKAFLDNLSEEHRQLYNKYRIAKNSANYKNRDGNREMANNTAREGMKKLRATRDKKEYAEQRKEWDKKYYEKLKEKAATVIQKKAREYIVKKKAEAVKTGHSMVDDLFKTMLDKIFTEKRKGGRTRKPRNPVGRPLGSKNKKK